MNGYEKEFIKYRGNSRVVKSQLHGKFKAAQRHFDKMLTKAARSYNQQKVNEIENMSVNNHKEFWGKLKQLGPRSSSSVPVKIKCGNEIITNEKQVLRKWKEDFSSLYNQANVEHTFNDEFLQEAIAQKSVLEAEMLHCNYIENDAINNVISDAEIDKVISKLKNKKATGEDEIPNGVIKCTGVRLFLHQLFNKCFEIGQIPTTWLNALIRPIPKGANKDPYVPLNYRAISLVSCVSKVYSGLLNNRIVGYFNELNLFPEEQNGFRKNRSCEDHIFSLSSIVKNRLAQNKSTYCTFVDLEKAFDWVNRDLLFFKLLCHNIDGKMYRAVQSLLGKTKSCIELNGCLKSDWFDITTGVRQGDSLSPTLFSIFINDLVSHLKENGPLLKMGNIEINMLLYADDMVLIGETENALQVLLNEMYKWCQNWRLKVNETKTKVVHFRTQNSPCTENIFMYGDAELEMVKQYKYLGIILDDHLNFNDCIKALADSSGRALGGIISKFKCLKNVGYETFTKLYKSGVQPISEYAAGVWGHHKALHIDTIQNRAMRYYLGVHKFAANAAIIADMGWNKPIYDRYICLSKFWNRVIQMSDDRLTKQIFMYDFSTCSKNWCSDMKKVFVKLDLEHIFHSKSLCDIEQLKTKSADLMHKNWKAELDKKPKLRSFRTYKTDMKPESYVQHCYNRQLRSFLAQIRCGILPLKIETGRFKNQPLDERMCEMCHLGKVESELHFLCECPLYNNYRDTLYGNVSIYYPNFQTLSQQSKFEYLMKYRWREVSKFIEHSWNVRRNKMYS